MSDLRTEILKKIDTEILPVDADYKPISFIMKFVGYLNKDKVNQSQIGRFLDYFGFLLDSINEDEMHKLRDDYSNHVEKLKQC